MNTIREVTCREWMHGQKATLPAAAQAAIYWAWVPSSADTETLRHTLQPDEWARAQAFRFEADRTRFVFCRALLRTILGHMLDLAPERVRFVYGSRGKPFLHPACGSQPVCFNVSHSGRLFAAAFCQGHPVGIDVESTERLAEWESMAGTVLSGRERSVLDRLPETERRRAFFRAWTRKEACLKATGEGLTDDLGQIEVTLAPGDPAKVTALRGDSKAASQWLLRDLDLAESYAGALAAPPDLRDALDIERAFG